MTATNPYRPPRHRTGLWVGVALVTVLALGTGLGVLLISNHGGGRHQADPSPTSTEPAVVVMAPSTPASSTTAAASSTTVAAPSPTPSQKAAVKPKPKPKPKPQPVLHVGQVSITRAAAGTQTTEVAKVLDVYFSGVNAHDAALLARALDPDSRFGPDTRAFASGIVRGSRTTHDTQIFLNRLARGADGRRVAAHLTFRSTQSRAEHPPHSGTCSLWSVTYTLTKHGSAYLISDSRSVDRAC